MDRDILQIDGKLRSRVILGLQKAIAATFDATNWLELGYVINQHEYINGHDRLLRSLRFGDEDYGACVFNFLTYLIHKDVGAIYQVAEYSKVKDWLRGNAPNVLTELGIDDIRVTNTVSLPLNAAEIVKRALTDADNLIQSSGAASAVDRLHTALHGYMKSVCEESGIPFPRDASITSLFKLIRTKHPALEDLGAHYAEVGRVLSGLSTIIDAVNTLRNHASVAPK